MIVPPEEIEVLAPPSTDEADFAGLTTWPAIRKRLVEIAHHKVAQVAGLIDDRNVPVTIIAADTTIVVQLDQVTTQRDYSYPRLQSLGQPPDDESWREVVKHWFLDYYAGRTHFVATAVVVKSSDGRLRSDVVITNVTFQEDVAPWLDWYLSTGEPRGKAGGYAIQGAGSIFVRRVFGSLSNVIGLPLERLFEMLSDTHT
ncbi:MAG: hypothetical protein B7Z55_09670 [Planctomycetales bacterium 12-60-4]|nr:MAG: hypothetical protein B7Z55_09670 [Planctomycetales bacterium 12-60-4]